VKSFDSAAEAKRNLRAAIENVAGRLGNTPTICRKCYVHPEVLTSYLDGNLVLEIKSAVENELRDDLDGLKPEEAAVLAMLRGRLARELSGEAGPAEAKRRRERLEITLCLALGWSGLFVYDTVFGSLPVSTILLTVSGGVLYSVGVVFHLWYRLRFQNVAPHEQAS
jgi:hypothetical protein